MAPNIVVALKERLLRVIRPQAPVKCIDDITPSSLDKASRLALIEKARWIEQLKVPDCTLSFNITSATEHSRVRKVKEVWTIEWVRQLPQDSVLWDVGANIGIFTLLAAVRPEVKRVVSIEPFYKNYSAIVENVLLNNLSSKVTVIAGGLSESVGYHTLKLQNLVAGGALHSLGDISNVFDHRSTVPVAQQECFSITVDELVKWDGIAFPTHMKVDIDGSELGLLRGAKQTLTDPRLRGLQIETMDKDEGLPRRRAVTELLEGAGFRIARPIEHASKKAFVVDLQFERA